jgi:hypothetical protein
VPALPNKDKTAPSDSSRITSVISSRPHRNNPALDGVVFYFALDLLFGFYRKTVRILDTSTDRDLATDDHIFLESVEVVDAT